MRATKEQQQELQALLDKHGELTVSMVLAAAKRKNSALHSAFEWDDEKAGLKWRQNQARTLIRSVRVIYENRDEQMIHVRRVPGVGEGVYKPAPVVASDVTDFSLALEELQAKLSAIQRTINELCQYAEADEESVQAKLSATLKALEVAQTAVTSIH